MDCSTMWYNCTVSAMRRLRIAYNNSLRRLLGIPKHNSASGMFVQYQFFLIFVRGCMIYRKLPYSTRLYFIIVNLL